MALAVLNEIIRSSDTIDAQMSSVPASTLVLEDDGGVCR